MLNNPNIFSAMTIAMSIYRTPSVLVFQVLEVAKKYPSRISAAFSNSEQATHFCRQPPLCSVVAKQAPVFFSVANCAQNPAVAKKIMPDYCIHFKRQSFEDLFRCRLKKKFPNNVSGLLSRLMSSEIGGH